MFKIFSKAAPDPVLDRTFGCAQARSLRKNFEAEKYAALEKQLQSDDDTDQRSFYFDVLAELQDRPPQFDQWIENRPHSADARLASGAQALDWAWQARGYVRSEDVSEHDWEQFNARLAFARAELEAALALDANDPLAFGYLIRYGLGASWSLDQATDAYRQATALEPQAWRPAFNYFTFLCQKWFGSHELMFDFARAVSRSAPEGADVHALVAYAHIERWLYTLAFEDNPQADDYWRGDDVFDELIDVYKLWVNKSYSSPYEKIAANAFLFCFSSLSAKEVMQVELERIGPYPSYTPWRYLGDPVEVYREIWNVAFEK
ncbi:MAG: hypothetical protein ACR2NM_15865 [Bythopirellula sp.]